MSVTVHLPDRFWPKVQPNPDTGCWEWVGARTDVGYGTLSVAGKTRYVHRLAYESIVGPIPAGLELDHLCRVRHCVNPAHLEAVTHQVNQLRGHTIAARNAVKTECVNGHPYDETNTYLRPDGCRDCRACKRERMRKAG